MNKSVASKKNTKLVQAEKNKFFTAKKALSRSLRLRDSAEAFWAPFLAVKNL